MKDERSKGVSEVIANTQRTATTKSRVVGGPGKVAATNGPRFSDTYSW